MKQKLHIVGFILFIVGIALITFAILSLVFHSNAKASAEPIICEGNGVGQDQEGCLTPTITPTPIVDCDGDTDWDNPNEDDNCVTPTNAVSTTPTASPSVTLTPTATPTLPPSPHGDGLSDGRSDGRSDGKSDPLPQMPNTGHGEDQ